MVGHLLILVPEQVALDEKTDLPPIVVPQVMRHW